MNKPAIEIETQLKTDAALRRLKELKEGIAGNLREGAASGKASMDGLSSFVEGKLKGLAATASLVGLAYKAVGAAVDFVAQGVASAAEAEAGLVRLQKLLEQRGQATAVNVQELESFNSQLERQYAIDDKAIVQVEAKLTAMGVYGADLKVATQLTLGLAQAHNKELNEAADKVAKSFTQGTDALKEWGENVATVEQLVQKYAGSADAAAAANQTMQGRVTSLGISFDNLGTAVGKSMTDIGNWITKSDVWVESAKKLSSYLDGATVLLSGKPINKAPLAKPDPNFKASTPTGPTVLRTQMMSDAEFKAEQDAYKALQKKQEEALLTIHPWASPSKVKTAKQLLESYADELAEYEEKLTAEQRNRSLAAEREYTGLIGQELERRQAYQERLQQKKLDELDRHYDEVQERIGREQQQREAWGVMAIGLTQNMVGGVLNAFATAAATGESINWGSLFGGLLTAIGTTAVSLGGLAIAAGALGAAVPLFAGLAGPQAIGLGAALTVAGFAAIATGTYLGAKSGKTPTATSAGSGGGGGSFAPGGGGGTPLGFRSDGTPQPAQTIVNVSLGRGMLFGSPRELAREIETTLRLGGTLRPGGA